MNIILTIILTLLVSCANAAQWDTYADLVTPASTSDFIMTWDDSATPYASKLLFDGVATNCLTGTGTWAAEADPVFSAADSFGISTSDIAGWDSAVTFTTTPSTVIVAGTNLSWTGNTLNASGGSSVEGTAVLSTGEAGGVKYLREDGDGTSSWQIPAGSGDVSKVGTPVDNQVAIWTGDGTAEGDTGFTYDGTDLVVAGNITGGGFSTTAADGDRTQIFPENTTYTPGAGEESIYNVGGDLRMAEGGVLVGSLAVTADLLTVISGTSAMGTALIASGACATTVTTTATGVATTDVISGNFNASPLAVTGYAASADGGLHIVAWPTSDNVNFSVCNNTAAGITPGAVTLNWQVIK